MNSGFVYNPKTKEMCKTYTKCNNLQTDTETDILFLFHAKIIADFEFDSSNTSQRRAEQRSVVLCCQTAHFMWQQMFAIY